jgi:hypothetical protein
LALLSGAGTAVAQNAADDGLTTPTSIGREEAVSLVLASDARFADLVAFETLGREIAADYRTERWFTSSYYRVLGPSLGDYADTFVTLRAPMGRLIEVNLAADCAEVELVDTALPIEDPCAWRHTWVFMVEPDGTVVPLYDTGDPEPLQ